ncbi:MAG: N(4)-(beta-N-acetylglucosaminyl)-L-asparaginase [Chitinophagaceae bacterium]|nr:N(4)-(beta-N-acetylglucosaminyl)-L-asparaginase [Chitinophagaceae bacterium]MBK8311557.1 N(4)-(beta-N-acetylglucosaminyl)-L-asparaginase [Chitinophagaceae bacterium]MBK8605667.1 N(4)-(beta-N-acetylglucosaminyl)-L-asparaginase [Chitinophagaceae bacterium]MBP6478048.1 N(4)-(beta-N-acetylglucosaminyl)-L-asparaginase [Chitinophagaceae bacterium]MBP7109248.1 N(4)-(beta-N-acetylglucosaminyl)-L-asparaginase [Chitinophagaceae bacterium]
MVNRRKFIKASALSSMALSFGKVAACNSQSFPVKGKAVVISTWDAGLRANKAAWEVLKDGGRALDAVEKGVMVTENEQNCCVGLGANPDRDGFVTLDACIMDEFSNCGSVAFLERIKHPVSVARRVMEKTPHVMLVGSGAQQFAVAEGFPLEEQKLSPDAQKNYDNWLKKSEYKPPAINVESKQGHGPFAPYKLENGEWNHDTIGMIAMDANGNLSGSCTTSGAGFKMRGRLGDSPIIGAGLFVDNEVGACTATGQGEDVIRVAGSHTVVELMRQGLSPEKACKTAIERIMRIKGEKAKDIQVGFLAVNKKGEVGAFAIHKGFSYAIKTNSVEEMVNSKYIME